MSVNENISRRVFVQRMAMLSSLSTALPATALVQAQQLATASPSWLQQHEWQTLAGVMETLFPPGEGYLGASDFGAVFYLHKAIENPKADGDDKDFIMRGVGWLNDLTQSNYQKAFVNLTAEQQDKTIATIVQSRAGNNWVSTLLYYILEALLSAPVYGGNAKQTGWQWLEYQPGFPLPDADKTWDKLLQRRYRS